MRKQLGDLKDAAITLAIAVLGAALGILNTWNSINDRRVRIRVVPKGSLAPGFSGMAIEVVNLSAFPITISEIGFTIGRSQGTLPRRAPIPAQMFVDGTAVPIKLDRHASFSGTFRKPRYRKGLCPDDIRGHQLWQKSCAETVDCRPEKRRLARGNHRAPRARTRQYAKV